MAITSTDEELAGRVAIVTGASAGIGRSTALLLASAGAAVVVADVDGDRGTEVATAIEEDGGRALFVEADVADDGAVAAMVDRAVSELGGLHLAFNNAGIEATATPTHEIPAETWQAVLAVNLTGVWSCMRHEIPPMLDAGAGAIVNCASVAGLVGFPGAGAYVASKHGVVGLSRAAALEYADAGLRVNSICPGVIDTEMVERVVAREPDLADALVASEPVGRLGRAEEVAEAVLWLCSDRSSFVTGQALAVDGGYVAR